MLRLLGCPVDVRRHSMHQSPRAQRFPLQIVVCYRQGDLPWQKGQTLNISSSGVLFERDWRDRMLDPSAAIEMTLIMPPEIVGAATTRVVCVGRVVRTVAASGSDARPALAATTVDYRLVRGEATAAG